MKHLNKYAGILILLNLMILFSFRPEEKYFEGTVDYKMSITSKSNKQMARQMQEYFGDRATFYFKNGSYKDVYNGRGIKTDYLDVTARKYYFQVPLSDAVTSLDATKVTDSTVSVQINNTGKKVAGYKCRELILKTMNVSTQKETTETFYFSDEFKVNPEWFKGIHISSTDVMYREMKCIPLKYILDYGDHVTTVTATNVTVKSLSDDDVHIPKGARIKQGDE